MGKGQVSEKELERGIKSLGGLTGITSSTVRRDSPFGSDFVKPVAAPATEPPYLKKDVERVNAEDPAFSQAPASKGRGPIESDMIPLASEAKPRPKIPKRLAPEESEEEGVIETSARTFSERVTLQMTAEMRDDLHYLATKLQRRKKNKEERITSNTVMRVAIQLLLDELKLKESDLVNSEAELLTFAKKKLLSK